MKKFALIVAGGNGTRMNSGIPKQFMLLNNKPILMHTIQRFFDFDNSIRIIIVLPQSQITSWNELCKNYNFIINHEIVHGGSSRYMSVRNGLSLITNNGIVFIHDGVRPLVSLETINSCYKMTFEKGNAVPVMPIINSLRILDNDANKPVDRDRFVSIQTPQTFIVDKIKKAYDLDFDPKFTDDTTVLERLGEKINLVDGNIENIKITYAIDIQIAKILLLNEDKL